MLLFSVAVRYWTFCLLLLFCGSEPLAAERPDLDRTPDPRDQAGPPRNFRGPGGPAYGGSAYGGRGVFDHPIEGMSKTGYLFVGGEYIHPPYEIRFEDDRLTVNGRTLECQPPPREVGVRGPGPGPRGPEGRPQSWRLIVNELQGQLNADLAVVAFADQPYVVLDSTATYDMLKSMMMKNGRSVRLMSVRDRLPEGFDRRVWDDWLDEFAAPAALLQRAAALVVEYEAAERAANAEMRATRLLNQLSYPLAVSGMVACVLALGHLLGGRPHARQPAIGLDESPEMIHSLNWSLLFVIALSFLDLTWTILAANAGQMSELNPIGSQLMENPQHLAGFKIGITLPSVALLWLLRRYKRAQVAAWWVCLILTFVTIRWLTLSPLYVAA
jgi:hypothetical protein